MGGTTNTAPCNERKKASALKARKEFLDLNIASQKDGKAWWGVDRRPPPPLGFQGFRHSPVG